MCIRDRIKSLTTTLEPLSNVCELATAHGWNEQDISYELYKTSVTCRWLYIHCLFINCLLHFILFQMNVGLFNTNYRLTEQAECFLDVLRLDLNIKFSYIDYIIYCTSNVTSVTEVRSASARLFAGMWRPWWVLLQHSIMLQLFFIVECVASRDFSAVCVHSKFGIILIP